MQCKCGCGLLLERCDNRQRKRKYIHGHNIRGTRKIQKDNGICKKCSKPFNHVASRYKGDMRCGSSKGLCRVCYLQRYYRKRRKDPNYLLTKNRRMRDAYRTLREIIFKHYGKECNCCGEKEIKFLTIDHVHGGGAKDRRTMALPTFMRKIISENFPKDKYQILCYNCNISKGLYGQCPHKGN